MTKQKDTTFKINISKNLCNWVLTHIQDTLSKSEIKKLKLWRDTKAQPHIDELEKLSYNNGLPVGNLIANISMDNYFSDLPHFINIKNQDKELNRFIKMTIMKTCSQRDVIDNYWRRLHASHNPNIIKPKINLNTQSAEQIVHSVFSYFHLDKDSPEVCNTFAKLRLLLDDFHIYTMMDSHVPEIQYNYQKMPLNMGDFKGFLLSSSKMMMSTFVFINSHDTPREQIDVLLKSLTMSMNGQSVLFDNHSTFTTQQNKKLNQVVKLMKKKLHYQPTNREHTKRDYMFYWLIINMLVATPPQITYESAFNLLNVKGTGQLDNAEEKLQSLYHKHHLVQMSFANEDRIGHLDVPK